MSIWFSFWRQIKRWHFSFVCGLVLPKITIKNFVIWSFRCLFGNFETNNWRIASKCGMGITNTQLHIIYSVFFLILKCFVFYIFFEKFVLKIIKALGFFIGFSDFWGGGSKHNNFENPRQPFCSACYFTYFLAFWVICFKNRFLVNF